MRLCLLLLCIVVLLCAGMTALTSTELGSDFTSTGINVAKTSINKGGKPGSKYFRKSVRLISGNKKLMSYTKTSHRKRFALNHICPILMTGGCSRRSRFNNHYDGRLVAMSLLVATRS